MATYYYLVAQLPSLSFGAPAGIDISYFVDLCETFLEEKDKALLPLLSLSPEGSNATTLGSGYEQEVEPCGSPLVDNWRRWERALRLHLGHGRYQRLKRESPRLADAPVDPLDAAKVARAALGIADPLEAETFLDRERWALIDRLVGFDYFGRDSVFAYYLKLHILQRRSLFTKERGLEAFSSVYASIVEAAKM
ncbi:MAG: DUF2764 domain-containing protein [Treponemataceae bacterium]|nr:DUF2764 domain-containing protein [Treponemataceae bacterium]